MEASAFRHDLCIAVSLIMLLSARNNKDTAHGGLNTYMQHDPSLIPFLPKGIDPKEIVAKAREGILLPCNADEPGSDEPSSPKLSKQFKAIVNYI